MYQLAKSIIHYSSFVPFLPLAIAVWNLKMLGKTLRPILWYLVAIVVIEIGATVMVKYHQNNLRLLHLLTILEFALIAWFYYEVLEGLLKRKIILAIVGLFSTAAIINSVFFQALTTFNTNARSLEGVLVIIFALLCFYKILSEMKIKRLDQEPVFWINTGFLLYYSGGVLLFAFSNYLLKFNKPINMYVWALHALFSTLLYVFIAVGLWKTRVRSI